MGNQRAEKQVCRICNEGEQFADQGEGIGYSVFLSKVCPASQTVDSIYEKAVSLPLADPEYKNGEPRSMTEAAGHARQPSPPRMQLQLLHHRPGHVQPEMQPLLDDHEKSLLITCERARGPIKEILQGFGKEAVARWSVRVEDRYSFELTAQQGNNWSITGPPAPRPRVR